MCANLGKNPQDTLENIFPLIAQQWHPTKNGDLKPSQISKASGKKIWWQCNGKNKHEWKEAVHSRTQRNRIECKYCLREQNSLESNYPEITSQWHPTKNGNVIPSQVSRASGKKVWWICAKNPQHEWQAQVKNRTVLVSGCPYCDDENNIIRLSEHLYALNNKDINQYHILLNNLHSLQKILSIKILNKRLLQPFYRMIYSAIITSIETYLSDVFIQNIFNDNECLEKFVTTNPDFKEKKYNFSEAINIYANIEKSLKEYLFDILWHNLPKVGKMYKQAFNVDFPSDYKSILIAINDRHDFVHRCGKTKEGTIKNIAKDQIINLINDSKVFIKHINDQFEKKNASAEKVK